ncbi:MAG TPA: ribosome maturation factor RimP [Peptococcaceae bacterium]|nr:ribosome maturation factor RimP [Peptococcaceae bacterium]HPZ71896.1 ribosome maturation factor RimP [Peptococcaceae bacterium]HQD53877.1 ribosome maturation factor RimP [Peptococcaceae bacterium]
MQDFVYSLAEPIVTENGMELVDVEFTKEGGNWYLRIYIDKDEGVDLDDCQKISTLLSDLLDQEDPIEQAYFLEVSSPGLDRPLKREKDFRKYEGHLVNVKTYSLVEGRKKWQGRLGPYQQDVLVLNLDQDQQIQIPWETIAQVKLSWEEEGRKEK